MIKSYTAFMAALHEGDVVNVRHHPSQLQEDTTLLICSSQIGTHFMLGRQMQIIPHVPASRTRIVDNGIALDIYRASGTLWWTVRRGVE